ncbi:MAG TPA: hypothetical protein VK858_20190, partial [Longimicrobiales bacterium]|nr:hypothetical protein [Longimicrobiales bacterium]
MPQVAGYRTMHPLVACASLLFLIPHPRSAQESAPESLGVVEFGASCDPAVLDDLDRGFALLHHMTYPAASSVFQEVAEVDPDCAVAYWGAAMTHFQPLWPNRPTPEDLRAGWALAREARRRVAPSGREAMFVATGEAFFDPDGDPDYWTRIERWAAATKALFDAYPEDREARAFFALSHLATASRGDAARHHQEAADVLATILAEEPAHPGAVHYLIHANDFGGRERLSLDVVRSYGDIAPANPHALHMPTHIFVRLGEWESVIEWNRRAAAAALLQPVGPGGAYVWDEYPHAVEYLVYAELQRGDDAAAEALIRALHDTPALQPSFKTAFHLASTPVRLAVERKSWAEAAALPARDPATLDWDAFPWPEALVWFGRGLGAAHQEGSEETVAESVDRLRQLSAGASAQGEAVFATQIDVLRFEVEAWGALATGDADQAVWLLEEAVDLEEATPKHPVTPGPMLPARELLGDLYLALGRPGMA